MEPISNWQTSEKLSESITSHSQFHSRICGNIYIFCLYCEFIDTQTHTHSEPLFLFGCGRKWLHNHLHSTQIYWNIWCFQHQKEASTFIKVNKMWPYWFINMWFDYFDSIFFSLETISNFYAWIWSFLNSCSAMCTFGEFKKSWQAKVNYTQDTAPGSLESPLLLSFFLLFCIVHFCTSVICTLPLARRSKNATKLRLLQKFPCEDGAHILYLVNFLFGFYYVWGKPDYWCMNFLLINKIIEVFFFLS